MHQQVGDLVFDDEGLALRGLLVRHLVMPNQLAGTEAAMRWLHDEISSRTGVIDWTSTLIEFRYENGEADALYLAPTDPGQEGVMVDIEVH